MIVIQFLCVYKCNIFLQKNHVTEPNLISKEQVDSSFKHVINSTKIRLCETDTVLLMTIPSKAPSQIDLYDDQIVIEKARADQLLRGKQLII